MVINNNKEEEAVSFSFKTVILVDDLSLNQSRYLYKTCVTGYVPPPVTAPSPAVTAPSHFLLHLIQICKEMLDRSAFFRV